MTKLEQAKELLKEKTEGSNQKPSQWEYNIRRLYGAILIIDSLQELPQETIEFYNELNETNLTKEEMQKEILNNMIGLLKNINITLEECKPIIKKLM